VRCVTLATPSSCLSLSAEMRALTPTSPEPVRAELKRLSGNLGAILFDFDGTLTASPGDVALRCQKRVELRERAPLLKPRLRALREAGLVLGIISKSSEPTICGAIQEAGLEGLFNGPLLGKAVGFEGKAGFIEELVIAGDLGHLGAEGLRSVALIDDDVRELERAHERGIQTYAAPRQGGLQEQDFDEIFAALGICDRFNCVSSTPASRATTPRSLRSRSEPASPDGRH